MKNKIKEYRKKLNITQMELASIVHVSSRTIISLETGQYNPSILLAYSIAKVFSSSIEDIFCLKENKKERDKKYE